MSPDELRALADALEPMSAAPRFDCLPVVEFCAWLRQCAEQRPVAYKHTEPDGSVAYFGADEAPCEKCVPLYAAPAAPQAEPKREPLSDDDINKIAWKQNLWTDGMIEFSFLAFAREVERAHGIGGSDEC